MAVNRAASQNRLPRNPTLPCAVIFSSGTPLPPPLPSPPLRLLVAVRLPPPLPPLFPQQQQKPPPHSRSAAYTTMSPTADTPNTIVRVTYGRLRTCGGECGRRRQVADCSLFRQPIIPADKASIPRSEDFAMARWMRRAHLCASWASCPPTASKPKRRFRNRREAAVRGSPDAPILSPPLLLSSSSSSSAEVPYVLMAEVRWGKGVH